MTFEAEITSNGASIAGNKDAIEELYEKKGFGSVKDEKTLFLSPEECLFLLESGKLALLSGKKISLCFENALKKFEKSFDKDIGTRYAVFKDLRGRGLAVKSGLKYGTHFRVYDRGVKPTKGSRAPWEHAKYLVHAASEGETISAVELSRFVRLSHSVKKKLWLGIVDSDGDVTYYQIMRVTP